MTWIVELLIRSSNGHIIAWRRCQFKNSHTHTSIRSVNWGDTFKPSSHSANQSHARCAFVWMFRENFEIALIEFSNGANYNIRHCPALPLRVFWTWNKLQYLFRHQLNDVEQMHKCTREWRNKCTKQLPTSSPFTHQITIVRNEVELHR